MGFIKLKNLFSGKNLPIVAGVVLVLGLFGTLYLTQQQQDPRSSAAGTGGTGNCATVNPSSGEDLVSDNCTIPSGFNGSIFGNNNTIQGGLGGPVGSIFGDGNTILGGMNGCINGNNNEIWGGVNGGVNGTGNIIHGGQGSGPCPNPTLNPPTRTPTRLPTQPPATCSDGIDNNNNGLIDNRDPVCHTDGDPNNPDSYDPDGSEDTLPRCSDNVDNDNNNFTDEEDSSCHTDGNPDNPDSYDPDRNGENGDGNTCADSIDNNNNGVIDGADPICHTDGNPDNPGSYDPNREESASPTVTGPAAGTTFSLRLLLHGIGKGGDSANPNSGGTENPLRPERNVTVEVFNSSNQLVVTKQGKVNFNAAAGDFRGTVNMGSVITTGSYIVKVKTPQFLRTNVPGIQNLTVGGTNQLPVTIMVNGDIIDDNVLNILDYNILMGCLSEFEPPASCTPANEILTDLDDDGVTNQFDYNLFLRELSNREGQ